MNLTLRRLGCFAFFVAVPLLAAGTDQPGHEIDEEVNVSPRALHLAVGAAVESLGGNLGMGVNLTSPFLFDHLALRLSTVYSFFDGVPQNSNNQATFNYTSIKLAVVGAGAMLSSFVRIYGGGGVMLTLPSSQLSAQNTLGGFGSFGFEFFFASQHQGSFYLEFGGSGGGRAEKLANQPTFGAGLMALAGTRFYL